MLYNKHQSHFLLESDSKTNTASAKVFRKYLKGHHLIDLMRLKVCTFEALNSEYIHEFILTIYKITLVNKSDDT